MPEIITAMEAKIEWSKMTNPFGAKESKPDVKTESDFLADIRSIPGSQVFYANGKRAN